LLALVADRDFFGHGIEVPFFGKLTRIPTGPAWFSLKTGAPIVPSFMVREETGHFRFVLEPPIYPPAGLSRDDAIVQITKNCVAAMERVIRRYPTQWYIFQPYWKPVTGVIL
jgi:KDO2-lipid IV(A) lauroyltransferase